MRNAPENPGHPFGNAVGSPRSLTSPAPLIQSHFRRYRACGLSLQKGQLLAYGLYLLAQKREGVQRNLFAVFH